MGSPGSASVRPTASGMQLSCFATLSKWSGRHGIYVLVLASTQEEGVRRVCLHSYGLFPEIARDFFVYILELGSTHRTISTHKEG